MHDLEIIKYYKCLKTFVFKFTNQNKLNIFSFKIKKTNLRKIK